MRKSQLLLLVAAACASATSTAFFVTHTQPHLGSIPILASMDEGTKEDPEARRRFEWMQLHDPKTGEIPANIRARELAFAHTLPTKGSYALYKGSPATIQSQSWLQRGPENYGGRTRALAVDADDERIILAAAASGGGWGSADSGTTWRKKKSPAP